MLLNFDERGKVCGLIKIEHSVHANADGNHSLNTHVSDGVPRA